MTSVSEATQAVSALAKVSSAFGVIGPLLGLVFDVFGALSGASAEDPNFAIIESMITATQNMIVTSTTQILNSIATLNAQQAYRGAMDAIITLTTLNTKH